MMLFFYFCCLLFVVFWFDFCLVFRGVNTVIVDWVSMLSVIVKYFLLFSMAECYSGLIISIVDFGVI